MHGKKEKVSLEKEINGSNSTDSSNSNADVPPVVSGGNSPSQAIASQSSEKSSSDSFYQKLSKFYESSGLSLLFNFRETSLDLYLFYKEVTERGGFHQVTKDGKWSEVTLALNSKSSVSMLDIQLQKLYANLLYQFEQTYFYRTPFKLVTPPGHSSGIGDSTTGKRKHCNSSHFSTVNSDVGDDSDDPMGKRKCNNNPCQLSTVSRTTGKEMKKDPDAPRRSRTGYQIFLKKECARLKKTLGENAASQNIRTMAIDAWRYLSESDRQPYIEESRKEREKYKKEMTTYKERRNVQNMKTEKMSSNPKEKGNLTTPSQADGDYHVTLEPDAENFFVPDESMVDLAFSLMKNGRSNDPIFQINWDEYCGSLDIPI